jgi:hypothetical protein
MFEATAKLKIREGELEGFKQQAANEAAGRQTSSLRLVSKRRRDRVRGREAYESPEALLEHQRAIAEAKMKLFREFVDGHTMAFYHDPSPALAQALEGMGTTYERFTYFQGLNAESKVEVPA